MSSSDSPGCEAIASGIGIDPCMRPWCRCEDLVNQKNHAMSLCRAKRCAYFMGHEMAMASSH